MVSLRKLSVPTSKAPQFVDITGGVQREVDASGVWDGVVMVRSRHTTAGITCMEEG